MSRYAERDFEKLVAARRQLLSLQEEHSKDEVSVIKQLADAEVSAAGDGGQGREMKFLRNKASEVGTEENKKKEDSFQLPSVQVRDNQI